MAASSPCGGWTIRQAAALIISPHTGKPLSRQRVHRLIKQGRIKAVKDVSGPYPWWRVLSLEIMQPRAIADGHTKGTGML